MDSRLLRGDPTFIGKASQSDPVRSFIEVPMSTDE
jgi:hypothetical protein